MFEVQFYAHFAQKYVTISKHKTLANAVKKARWAYTDGGHNDVSILMNKSVRLDRYGKGCEVCNSLDCSGTDCHIED